MDQPIRGESERMARQGDRVKLLGNSMRAREGVGDGTCAFQNQMGSISSVEVESRSIAVIYPIARRRSLGVVRKQLQLYPSAVVEEHRTPPEFCGLFQWMKKEVTAIALEEI